MTANHGKLNSRQEFLVKLNGTPEKLIACTNLRSGGRTGR